MKKLTKSKDKTEAISRLKAVLDAMPIEVQVEANMVLLALTCESYNVSFIPREVAIDGNYGK